MFQFPALPYDVLLYSHTYDWSLHQPGSPIRKSAVHRICAPLRSLSQLVTSFIGSWCQGIPLAPFIAWPLNYMGKFCDFVDSHNFLFLGIWYPFRIPKLFPLFSLYLLLLSLFGFQGTNSGLWLDFFVVTPLQRSVVGQKPDFNIQNNFCLDTEIHFLRFLLLCPSSGVIL